MNIILISSLLSAATFVLHVAASKESLEASVSVRPPGSNIYLGECVLLQCTVGTHCTFVRSYWWYKAKPLTFPNPRHLISGDSYYITAVTREDADSYWCQVKCQENKTLLSVDALPVTLRVSGNFTSPEQTPAFTSDSWKWITLSLGILFLFLILLTVWLVSHYRYQVFCTRICWPVYKQEVRAELPVTKQDATEVQWDLSWMEMSSLLDKDLYHGT